MLPMNQFNGLQRAIRELPLHVLVCVQASGFVVVAAFGGVYCNADREVDVPQRQIFWEFLIHGALFSNLNWRAMDRKGLIDLILCQVPKGSQYAQE